MTDTPDPFWWQDEDTRPRRVEGGIQIRNRRGKVARTWWSGRFLSVVECLGIGGRLSRGRSYARAGQIVSLDVDAGGAVAQVQGSRPQPYRARIGVPAYGKTEWTQVLDALAADASYAAALLAGEMPRGIEDVFDRAGLSLFPATARDLVMDCSCPDFAVPCKHLAAVFYVLAERFDADPFQILALRGRDRETVLDDLRARRGSPAPTGVAPLADLLDTYFVAGPGLGERIAGPRTPSDALLDQVPEFPVAVRGASVVELLRPAYQALADPDGE
ncbi:SWIM zinc finger family protein [Pseudonocardia petroleophila]|uniref:SWIM zinc finger family protein n=1 Tax=Pseudonocardia petroleophila TaxID=37331 RepID=A0A7G7MDI7_9PSEU|nr:SWIM zinc finger family protein [Pseudonocardia petroleophila]QNG50848.1 SWIM zinc finger family protein [Pseudonocardia petroleophila]